MSKEVVEIDARGNLVAAVNEAWDIIHNATMTLMVESCVNKEDLRIWMSPSMMRFIGSAYQGTANPIMELNGITVLYGYEHDTIVVSHIKTELFDLPATVVAVKII